MSPYTHLRVAALLQMWFSAYLRNLGETADERWDCLNGLSDRRVAVRMLHMMYEPDVKDVSNRFTSLRDAVREGRLALCAYHKLTTETER